MAAAAEAAAEEEEAPVGLRQDWRRRGRWRVRLGQEAGLGAAGRGGRRGAPSRLPGIPTRIPAAAAAGPGRARIAARTASGVCTWLRVAAVPGLELHAPGSPVCPWRSESRVPGEWDGMGLAMLDLNSVQGRLDSHVKFKGSALLEPLAKPLSPRCRLSRWCFRSLMSAICSLSFFFPAVFIAVVHMMVSAIIPK